MGIFGGGQGGARNLLMCCPCQWIMGQKTRAVTDVGPHTHTLGGFLLFHVLLFLDLNLICSP